ncbi:hypothetical protein [Humibacter sp. RRB41]|uniref:hypothetical protein n=1 Tax=Humibacter sp. RRB41 TaxID=2919946 RepID=UPI001FAAE7DE|nr:hypothetical protein [Humibacter sp. RRB41]
MTTNHNNPMLGQVLLKSVRFDSGYDVLASLERTDDIDEANAITSKTSDLGDGVHKLLLDIDLPVQVFPSSTPGHFHLYIDHPIQGFQEKVVPIIDALAAAGIVEQGYAAACRDQGFTTLRLPWVKKEMAA